MPPTEDPFDRIPDSLLLSIFNRLDDIKALGRCFAVSKRFNSLVLQLEEVVLKVGTCVILAEGKGIFEASMRGILKLLVPKKLFKALFRLYHPPLNVLKNFKGVRHLRIKVPGDVAVHSGSEDVALSTAEDNSGNIPESFFTDGGLKLRRFWTCSCLVAAFAGHYRLQSTILDHPTLESLVLVDAVGEGTLCMNKQQLHDFHEKPIASVKRTTRLPAALSGMIWYAPLLDLPGGTFMEIATLVSVRPSGSSPRKDLENYRPASNVFGEPFDAALRSLIRKRP